MTTVIPRAAGHGRGRGISAGPLGLVRAAAFAGLLLGEAALLVLVVAPVVLAALGLGHLLQDLLRQSSSGVSRNDVIAAVVGLAGLRFAVPAALLGTRRLASLTRRLSARWCGVAIGEAYRPAPAGTHRSRLDGRLRLGYPGRMRWLLDDVATWRDLLWIPVNAVVGMVFVGLPLALVAAGGMCLFADLTRDPSGNARLTLPLFGVLLPVLGAAVSQLVLVGYGGLARAILAPSEQAELELRVRHLAQTREESLGTGAAELRRIERDLHDGAQARLVAMGLTLDAAGRLVDTDPAAARALLVEARDASAKALGELRDLVRGIHPPVLADRGLADAVRALALDGPVRATVRGALPGRVPAPVESAAYFAVSELLANVAKHAGVLAAEVDLRHEAGALRISVRDEGGGGADPARGTGLRGTERRLAAFDGVLAVSSPVGGPTVVTLEVPCALP
jgi:signal transduction histidine kinase